MPSLSKPSSGNASVWQMPVAMISTRTSPALGPSRSTSTISSGCLGANATAARVFISRFPNEFRRALPPELASANAESMQGSELDGRHALITGGGTGIGAAAATCLGALGAKLSLLGRRLDPVQRTAGLVGGTAIRCDVTDADQLRTAFDAARAANGPIELLIVNAGIAESAPFHKMTRDTWDRVIATNLTAAFDCAQAALPDLMASENGRLVFV